MKNKDVVKMWLNGKENFEKGDINLLIIDGILYSYGKHFPLALRYKDYILVSSEKYSSTTSKHASIVMKEANNAVKVPHILWKNKEELFSNISYILQEKDLSDLQNSLLEEFKNILESGIYS